MPWNLLVAANLVDSGRILAGSAPRWGVLALSAMAASCAPAATPSPGPVPGDPVRLPAVPAVQGPLTIDVVYPGEGQTVGAVDSTFVFGSVGNGAAALVINGAPVEVAPNGAFLAYLPVPADGRYEVVASTGQAEERLTRTVQRPAGGAGGAGSAQPRERRYTTTLADGRAVEAGWTGVVRSGRADGTAIGTAVPGSGTPYHWFFPDATELFVVGARQGQLRVRLTGDLSVWVDSAAVIPVPPPASTGAGGDGMVAVEGRPAGYVGTVSATPYADRIDVRLATSRRLPHRIDPAPDGLIVTVYGAGSRTNNLLYGATDPLLERMEWEQVGDDLYRLHIRLAQPLWGYRSHFDGQGRLVVSVRRPPPIDAAEPLRGLYIGVDAGHPPGGAIGPTRLTEAEATLGVSRYLAAMLEARGARVLQTRPDEAPVGLGDRPLQATAEGVDLLVSVHFDAFGDGVNPFENHGTHVFYNQAQSLDLARAVQRELLAELGLRDLGVSRRDLALVRPTWMPSILSESAFMMIPRNEAALRQPDVLRRIAEAHVRGIEAFLRERAAR